MNKVELIYTEKEGVLCVWGSHFYYTYAIHREDTKSLAIPLDFYHKLIQQNPNLQEWPVGDLEKIASN
jgi:hypothetical protein